MSVITSKQMFINMKRIPDKMSKEYIPFFEEERKKIKSGVTINGTLIPGWLYWHINHWTINIDTELDGHVERETKKPDLRDNEWMIGEAIHEAERDKNGLLILGSRQLGKDLINSSILYTKDGEITIGESKVGQLIYDDKGKLTTITGVYPQGKQSVYEITLRDGRKLFTGLNHNNYVWDSTIKTFKVATTKELINTYKKNRKDNKFESRYFIPNNSAVNYTEKKLPIDPYFFGCWLGDGNSDRVSITTEDVEIKDYIYCYVNSLKLSVYVDCYNNYLITTGKRGGDISTREPNTLLNSLKNLNLIYNKHIPEIYLKSSIEQRLELLRGLMDTDGSCDKNGTIEFSSSIPKLSKDFYKLCRSLGINIIWKKRMNSYSKNGIKKNTKEGSRFRLYTTSPIFKLKRKLDNIYVGNTSKISRETKTGIIDIKYYGEYDTTCIMVNNDSHLFLTDNYTITHNSEFGASYLGRRSIAFKNSQNIVAGLSEPDLLLLTSKADMGFNSLHPFFRPTRITNNWNKLIEFGFKDKQGNRSKYSEILIRNLDGGKNTENLAGPTTSSLLLDEVGKGDFLEAFIAARPALETKFGWRCSPVFTGTSGSFEKSADLQKFHSNLKTYNFRTITLLGPDGKPMDFIPGNMASRADRKIIRLSTFTNKPKGSELDEIAIHVVRDKEVENRRIKAQIKEYERINEFTLAKKEQMYYPITKDDLWLINDTDNPFTDIKELCKMQLEYLEGMDAGTGEEWGWIERDSETGKPTFRKCKAGQHPITTFPTDEKEDKDAPIIIFDHPLEGQEFGILHVAGSDPYNQDESFYSTSLGTVYIYRRTYDPLNGRFQESIVASYSARPKSISRWQEQVRLLLEYYGATILPENEEASFIRYFDTKNLGHYVEDGLDLAKEISPDTEVKRRKGLAATIANQRYGNGLIRTYCLEDIVVGQTPQGEPIIKKGVVRIKDKMLLREIIAYVPKLNVDRIVGFRHALILATNKQKYHPVAKVAPVSREKKKEKLVHSPFNLTPGAYGGAFKRTKKSPFGRM